MPKDILIFSDGTGQLGGLRPDQRLSNVYKMYRAMRPGPDSPISPKKQVAFYDPGLGTGEAGGITFRWVRNILAAAVGTGIDENVIDCYSAIIADYEPGDRIHLIGFSRGAYTVRVVANVLNLCGVPTRAADGGAVPRYGPALRKIASDAVRYVYNHGAGHERGRYEAEREEKARRFRRKYGSEGVGADGEGQGNVQPTFVGVFDTVAALGSRSATLLSLAAFGISLALAIYLFTLAPFWVWVPFSLLPIALAYWAARSFLTQWKYFLKDETRRLRWWNPCDWPAAIKHGHIAWWSGKLYDHYVDREIPFLRHALSIDEARAKFPRVAWARSEDVAWNNERENTAWLKQVWFAGNHSDIGGSYPENESRLSDITLQWMLDEFRAAILTVNVRDELLVATPDPLGLQHDEIEAVLDLEPTWLRALSRNKLTWIKEQRQIHPEAELHPTVYERLKAAAVPQMGRNELYRPQNLCGHNKCTSFFRGDGAI